jgi:ABC-type nitrate/sulfonate/bicarbonate transport system substrate-binding protein
MDMMKTGLLASASFALLVSADPAPAQELPEVKVISFHNGNNWPIWAAEARGDFAKNGIRIALTYTPGSEALITGLVEGKFDIAIAAIDNMVAYQEGQSEVKVEQGVDLVAVMGVNNGFNSLMAAPHVRDVTDLKGRKVAVDAPGTAFALVLYDILRRNGLRSGDYLVEVAGGASRRWEALREGKQDGTLLSLPWDIIAADSGFKRLATSNDLGRYQGTAGIVRRKWAAANEASVVGFIRAYIAGYDWISDPANRDEAMALLRKNIKGLTPGLAQASYSALLAPTTGLQRKAELDVEGLRTVLALRSEYGQPRKTLTDPLKYYDPSYYKKALGN